MYSIHIFAIWDPHDLVVNVLPASFLRGWGLWPCLFGWLLSFLFLAEIFFGSC